MLPALPTGMQSASSRPSRSSSSSNAAVFWPCRRNSLTELTSAIGWRVGELAHQLERGVEVAAQRDHARAVDQRLGELAGRDLAVGDDHGAAQPGLRRVGGGARGGVAGRGADHRLRRRRARAADTAQVMPRSLNEPVGLVALELEVDLGADALRQPLARAPAASSPRRASRPGRSARTAAARGSARSARPTATPLTRTPRRSR